MELDERKVKILKAIISNYLETGEPVGSRTISKYTDLNLSSATIRNEMADLEEMGYIIQPHTSAGRIPTDAGYRFYVDQLMDEKEEFAEVAKQERDTLLERVDRMEVLLKQVAKVLAYNTNYATMVTAPNYEKTVKFIQLSLVDEKTLLAVIVVEGNIIKNQMIHINVSLDNEDVLKFNILLNTFLQGASLEDINLEMIQAMKKQSGGYGEILDQIFQGIVEAIHEAQELEVYTSGATNILKYPELGDISKTSELLEKLEDKNEVSHLLEETTGKTNDSGIQVYIGDEVHRRPPSQSGFRTPHHYTKRLPYIRSSDSLFLLSTLVLPLIHRSTLQTAR